VKGHFLPYKNDLKFVLKMKYELNKYNGSYRKITSTVVCII